MRKKFTRNDIILLQDFIDTIDDEIIVNKSKRFECSPLTKEVYVGFKDIDNLDLQFIEWFKQQPEYIEINIVLCSILHEIGHCFTYDEQRNAQRDTIEQMLVFMYEQNAITEKEMNFAYFNIESERLATMWGINFYNNNKSKCNELVAMLGL